MSGVVACGSDRSGRGDSTSGNTTPDAASTSQGSRPRATGGSESSGATTDAEGSAGPPVRFDLGPIPDAGAGLPTVSFSHIWIANSVEGTVSKIDTETAVELGRYYTGPTAASDPSRTSVNLYGDAAVMSRGAGVNGGVAKFAAAEYDCVDRNDNGVIDTATGASPLRWEQDECLLWYRELPARGTYGPRPVAWEPAIDGSGRPIRNPRLWVGYFSSMGTAYVLRLDGATGDTLDEVVITDFARASYGPYGGATDRDGNFWMSGWGEEPLIRIDAATLDVRRWDGGSGFYGMTLDATGRPYIATLYGEIYTLDAAADNLVVAFSGGRPFRGITSDLEGRLWAVTNSPAGFLVYDPASSTVVTRHTFDDGTYFSTPVGAAVDRDGFVWVVDQGEGTAYKIDPDTFETVATVTGLVGPYTYSDMTGGGLRSVVNPVG